MPNIEGHIIDEDFIFDDNHIIYKYPRRVLPVFYMIDTSASMSGARIASVTNAMHETMESLAEISAENCDVEIKVGVLTFGNNDVKWVTNGLEDPLNHRAWTDFSTYGLAPLSEAIDELVSKMSSWELFDFDKDCYAPVIIFMSDYMSGRIHLDDYRKSLEEAKENIWFRQGIKIAIAIGDDADADVLAEITGNSELVVRIDDVDKLKRFIFALSTTLVTHFRSADSEEIVRIVAEMCDIDI